MKPGITFHSQEDIAIFSATRADHYEKKSCWKHKRVLRGKKKSWLSLREGQGQMNGMIAVGNLKDQTESFLTMENWMSKQRKHLNFPIDQTKKMEVEGCQWQKGKKTKQNPMSI